MVSDRTWQGRAIVVSVVHKDMNRNDTGDWLLIIKLGSSVQHIKLDVDGRAEKPAAIVAAEAHLATCGVVAA